MSRLTAWIRSRRKPPEPVVEDEPVVLRLPPTRQHERVQTDWASIRNAATPEYPELAMTRERLDSDGSPPIFITARFRTGSTMLWNILRHVPDLTTYYEPLHPALQWPLSERPQYVDPTHDDVSEYWSEYDRIPDLASYYNEPWHNTDLYLDASHWKPNLARYVQLLVNSAQHRAALQFNRVDFRLAWLRKVFPAAQLVHLFRHPRDQWLSVLRDPATFGPDGTAEEFMQHDYFFMLEWVHDLSAQFPVLDWDRVQCPYTMHYLLWKLSYLWGRAYSDLSVSYEQLLSAPHETLSDLFDLLGIDQRVIPQVMPLIHSKARGKWRNYADAEWFAKQESHAESLLDNLLGQDIKPHFTARLRAA